MSVDEASSYENLNKTEVIKTVRLIFDNVLRVWNIVEQEEGNDKKFEAYLVKVLRKRFERLMGIIKIFPSVSIQLKMLEKLHCILKKADGVKEGNEACANIDVAEYSYSHFYRLHEKAILLRNSHESLVNFEKVCAGNSRWGPLKRKLVEMGIIKSNELYLSLPIFRPHFIMGAGNFGNVEVALCCKNLHAIALKRLTEHNVSFERCEALQCSIRSLSTLVHTNLLKMVFFQDICGYSFIYTRLCDWNLMDYLGQLQLSQNLNGPSQKRLIQQIVNGLRSLHSYSPSIVHGNLKPTNIVIDEHGTVKLSEYGISKHLYETEQDVSLSDKIWWPNETEGWFKIMKCCHSTTMSDIYSCGLIILLIVKFKQISTKQELLKRLIASDINNTAVFDLIQMMIQTDALKRPTITEVANNIYFWSTDQHWSFLQTCVELANAEYSVSASIVQKQISANFRSTLANVLHRKQIKLLWMQSAFQHLPSVGIPYSLSIDNPVDLLKFLGKCKMECPQLFFRSEVVMRAFPELTNIFYKALKHTNWFQSEYFKLYSPFATIN